MRAAMLEKMAEALDYPVYVFRQDGARITLDKVTCQDKKLSRDRYLLAGGQCTCMGYVKFQHCKHLDMLKEEPGKWIKKGVPGYIAVEETQRIMAMLCDVLGKVAVAPLSQEEADLPDVVFVVTIEVTTDDLKNLHRLVSRKDLGTVGDLGIILKVRKT